MSAGDNILRRIREANGHEGATGAKERETILARLDARVRGPMPTMDWETLPRFRERCIAMMSTIDEAGSFAEVPRAVASYLKQKNMPTCGAFCQEIARNYWTGLAFHCARLTHNFEHMRTLTG